MILIILIRLSVTYLCNVQRFRDLFYKALYKFIIIIIIKKVEPSLIMTHQSLNGVKCLT